MLGDCNYFPANYISSIKVFHELDDGWRGDFVKIFLNGNEFAFCPLDIKTESLDDNSHIVADCHM